MVVYYAKADYVRFTNYLIYINIQPFIIYNMMSHWGHTHLIQHPRLVLSAMFQRGMACNRLRGVNGKVGPLD